MDRGGGDRRLPCGDGNLVEAPHHVAGGVQPGDGAHLVRVDDEASGFVQARSASRPELGPRTAAQRQIEVIEPLRGAVRPGLVRSPLLKAKTSLLRADHLHLVRIGPEERRLALGQVPIA